NGARKIFSQRFYDLEHASRWRADARPSERRPPMMPSGMEASERLDPWPQLDLEAPGAAMLAMDRKIGFGDRIRREAAVRTVTIDGLPGRLDLAVDDEMRDMDILRAEFARHRLR